MRRWWTWFTLLILGSCSAFVVPNLLNAQNRSKQNRTMADMRSIATAVESYEVDHPDWKGDVTPSFGKLPLKDGWNRPFHIQVWTDKDNNPSYRIWSAGRDGKRDTKWGNPAPTRNFDNDVVYENGTFTQYPEGA